MSNYDYFLRTSDEHYVVLVPALMDEDISLVSVEDVSTTLQFDLCNTLSASVLRDARRVVSDAGLRLRDLGHMAMAIRKDGGYDF